MRWPHGPFCPLCGNADPEKIAKGQGKVARSGLYYCSACNGQFTVTVGTVMERSKIPLSKWLLAMHLLGSSKKGMSAHQLHRMLGVTYKTAWFMAHRIREAMKDDPKAGPLGSMKRRRLVWVRAYPCLRNEVRVSIRAHVRPVSYRYNPDQLVFAF